MESDSIGAFPILKEPGKERNASGVLPWIYLRAFPPISILCPMAHAFFLGVDLDGDSEESLDATLTILEKAKEEKEVEAQYRLDHIRVHAGVTSIEDLAGRIQGLVADQPYIGRTNIIINRESNVGRALDDALTDLGLDTVSATLTRGSGTVPGDRDEVGVHLGTGDVVRTLAELYRDGRFVIEDYSKEAVSKLARDIQRAAEALDEADGNQETPEASGSPLAELGSMGSHITSAALAAWCGTERSFDPSQHLKEDPQTGRGREGDAVG